MPGNLYRQLVLICRVEPLCQAWNVHVNYVCFAHTVNVSSLQLLEQSWKQWSYFSSKGDWFYKLMFKLLENSCYLCKSANMVNMKASCLLHPNMLGHLTWYWTHDASVTFNGFIQLLWHSAELCRCRWQHSTRYKEPMKISRF